MRADPETGIKLSAFGGCYYSHESPRVGSAVGGVAMAKGGAMSWEGQVIKSDFASV